MPIGKHLVFATHYYCADFTIFLLLSPLLVFAPATACLPLLGLVTVAGMGWLGWWAVLADRRVYGGGWAGSVVRGLVVLGADLVISLVAGQLAITSVFLSRG